MHFNVYMDDQTGQQLNAAAQQQGQTRETRNTGSVLTIQQIDAKILDC